MPHHTPDDLRTSEEIAAEYFTTVLSSHLDADLARQLANELANGLRGYSTSIVLVQNGHLTRALEAMDALRDRVMHLEAAQNLVAGRV